MMANDGHYNYMLNEYQIEHLHIEQKILKYSSIIASSIIT